MGENETLEQAQSRLNDSISLATDMKELLVDERFIRLFEEVYIRAFAITNTYNIANADEATRARIQEKMVSRSHFTQFINRIVADGNLAVNDLAELKELAEAEDADIEELINDDEEESTY